MAAAFNVSYGIGVSWTVGRESEERGRVGLVLAFMLCRMPGNPPIGYGSKWGGAVGEEGKIVKKLQFNECNQILCGSKTLIKL